MNGKCFPPAGSSSSGASSVVSLLCTPEYSQNRNWKTVFMHSSKHGGILLLICGDTSLSRCSGHRGWTPVMSIILFVTFSTAGTCEDAQPSQHDCLNEVQKASCPDTALLPFTNLVVTNEEWDCAINYLLKVIVDFKLCCIVLNVFSQSL